MVVDVQSPAPPVVTPPLQPLSSIGDKRKHSETMSNSITLSATSQGYSFQVGAGATTWDHRAMALRGLYRKSCTRYHTNVEVHFLLFFTGPTNIS